MALYLKIPVLEVQYVGLTWVKALEHVYLFVNESVYHIRECIGCI